MNASMDKKIKTISLNTISLTKMQKVSLHSSNSWKYEYICDSCIVYFLVWIHTSVVRFMEFFHPARHTHRITSRIATGSWPLDIFRLKRYKFRSTSNEIVLIFKLVEQLAKTFNLHLVKKNILVRSKNIQTEFLLIPKKQNRNFIFSYYCYVINFLFTATR